MNESWQILFGRDRATSEVDEDAAELDDVPADPVETINPVDLFNDCYTPSFANGDPAFVYISTSSETPTSYAIPPLQEPMRTLRRPMLCQKGLRRRHRWTQKRRPFMTQ
ncbi:hypothetical protein RHGRI_011755 [Rhododendron griersonianum]|uniref:Uncharacterized protein n=1 Tax=Rhododendron griersonianum TaxID=479676 RepID=A0AAV6KPD5_9ERIC|nr:hypothetical protein RHGRI_011755 [Rhododendron griersonianum]